MICMALLLCTGLAAAAEYAEFSDLAADFDARAHLEIGGSQGERFVKSGPDFDRVQKVADKLKEALEKMFPGYSCNYPVYLVADDSFNAAASVSRVYINTGTLKRCTSDDLLAPVIAHEMAHIINGDLKGQYNKRVGTAKQVDRAIEAVKKPGYEENAELMAGIGSVLITITDCSYSQTDENKADADGFELSKRAGYDVEAGLGIFDMMGRGFGGLLGRLSSHPSPSERRKRVVEAIEQGKANDKAVDLINKAAEGIVRVDSTDLAKTVRSGSFTGYAHRMLTTGKCLYLLCEGEGELRYNKKTETVILPIGTKEVYVVAVNPKAANFFGKLRIEMTDYSPVYKAKKEQAQDVQPVDSLALKVPIQVLQPGQKYRVAVALGTVPFSGEQTANIEFLTFRSCLISFEKDPAEIASTRIDEMKALMKQKPIKVGSADPLLQFHKDAGVFPGYSAKEFDRGLFYVLSEGKTELVASRNSVRVPWDSSRVELIFCNKKDSANGMDVELSCKPDCGALVKLKSQPGAKGLLVSFPPDLLCFTDEVTLKSRFWKDAEGKQADEKQITLKFVR